MARIAIVGGAIAGLGTALALVGAGHEPLVFERRTGLDSGGGAMLMWPNGFAALEALGLGDRTRALATEIRRIEFRTRTGRPVAHWSVDGGGSSPVRLVFRDDVVAALASAISPARVCTGAAVSSCTLRPDGVALHFDDGRPSAHADALIACDGVHSRIRTQLFGRRPQPTLEHLAWVATVLHDDTDLVPPGVAVGSMGNGQRFCAARVDASRVFWYATIVATRRPSAPGPEGLAAAFDDWHPPIAGLIRRADDAMIGPVELGDMPPLRRWGRGRATLLGDAVHACLPDLGQGAGQALESAVALAACVRDHAAIEDALRAYEDTRRPVVAEVMRTSRFVAKWSMSEALHVTALRDLVAGPLLSMMGFPAIARLARIDAMSTTRNSHA